VATVIAVYNSEGCVGRCDARCHDAKGFDCNCICGGANHGVGEKIAREDSRYITDEEIFAEADKLYGGGHLRIFRPKLQLKLFV